MGFLSKIGRRLKKLGKRVVRVAAPFIPVVGGAVSGLIAARDQRKAQRAAEAEARAQQQAFASSTVRVGQAPPTVAPATRGAFGLTSRQMLLGAAAVGLLVFFMSRRR